MKNWQINRTVYKVSDFVAWQKAGTLDLTPYFQRRPVWKRGAKSYLIDTIIRGLPIPIIFIRDRQSATFSLEPLREVVDGQQRLRTIISYIQPKYLSDFNIQKDVFTISKAHNKQLANKKFEDLDQDIKQSILDYQFSVHVLPADISDRDILQIFARMNSTGTKLNFQELRNAQFFGEFKTSVYNSALKYLHEWKKWKIFTEENISRMDEVELTTEFYSLMLKGVTGKSQSALDNLYEKYDDEDSFLESEVIESRFETVLDYIDANMGEFISQSAYKKKTIFYILFSAVYDLCFGMDSDLKPKKHKTLTIQQFNVLRSIGEDLDIGNVSPDILEAATRRTTNPKERLILFKYFKSKLNG